MTCCAPVMYQPYSNSNSSGGGQPHSSYLADAGEVAAETPPAVAAPSAYATPIPDGQQQQQMLLHHQQQQLNSKVSFMHICNLQIRKQQLCESESNRLTRAIT